MDKKTGNIERLGMSNASRESNYLMYELGACHSTEKMVLEINPRHPIIKSKTGFDSILDSFEDIF